MGTFELAVLASVTRLRDKAYGRLIHRDLEVRMGRTIADGQVYVVLNRLQDQGLLKATLGEPTAVRGGRAKKVYEVTGLGQRRHADQLAGLGAKAILRPAPQGV